MRAAPTSTSSRSALCQQVIAALATSPDPTAPAILAATREQIGSLQTIPAQVDMQVVAGTVAAYLRHYRPPLGWRFTGHDLDLGSGHSDLTWTNAHGAVIADTVLADLRPARAVIHAAAASLIDRAHATHGDDLVLARVLVPRTPELSHYLAHRNLVTA